MYMLCLHVAIRVCNYYNDTPQVAHLHQITTKLLAVLVVVVCVRRVAKGRITKHTVVCGCNDWYNNILMGPATSSDELG